MSNPFDHPLLHMGQNPFYDFLSLFVLSNMFQREKSKGTFLRLEANQLVTQNQDRTIGRHGIGREIEMHANNGSDLK